MPLDEGVSTTWGGALADIRDKVGGMANWSILEDFSGGASQLSAGDWFVLTAPSGEDVRIVMDTGNMVLGPDGDDALSWEYGTTWDTQTDVWGDKYAVDASTLNYDGLSCCIYGRSYLSPSDDVTYHLYYVSGDGWMIYVDRNVGDGQDADIAFGMARIDPLWNYSTAANRESDYCMIYRGQRNDQSNVNVMGAINFFVEGANPPSENTINAQGRTNPDANYSNFPLTKKNLVASSSYSGGGGTDTLVGTHDVWMEDLSGTGSAHGDTIQDSAGNNLFKLLKAHEVSVGVKMP